MLILQSSDGGRLECLGSTSEVQELVDAGVLHGKIKGLLHAAASPKAESQSLSSDGHNAMRKISTADDLAATDDAPPGLQPPSGGGSLPPHSTSPAAAPLMMSSGFTS